MNKKIKTVVMLCSALAILLCGCSAGPAGGQGAGGAGAEAPENAQILLRGLGDQDITVTLEELMELESVTEKAEAPRSNGQIVSVKAEGPLLDTLMAKYGKSKSDYSTIRFYAADGYSIAMPSEVIEKDDIIIAYKDDGKWIGQEDGPLRVVVPGERAMYWVRMLSQIDFENGESAQTPEKLIILDTALPAMKTKKIEINGASVTAAAAEQLIAAYGDINDNTIRNVFMKASDGLSKNETRDNFMANYIRIGEDGTLEFTGQGLPEGMTVQGLMTVNYGDTAFVSMKQYADSLGIAPGQEIPASSVLRDMDMANYEEFEFEGIDGSSIEIRASEMANMSLLYDGSSVCLAEEGMIIIRNLLEIEAES